MWLAGYIRNRLLSRPFQPGGRVWVAICDHWEPYWLRPSDEVAASRVATWMKHWPEVAGRHADSAGRAPQYTFFYPQEEYRPQFLDALAELRRAGIADVDVHIHHNREGEQNFVDRMSGFVETLVTRHGLLRQSEGRPVFGFIHGNWALANSLPNGLNCGLNNEITLLRRLGCYADFTMPSGNSLSQARTLNSIYWVTDDPTQPRSYDQGDVVRPGHFGSGDLLMITGPMGLRYGERLSPRIETGEIAHQDFATAYRVKRWFDLAPRIGKDIFFKFYSHGAQERNSSVLLHGELDRLFTLLAEACTQGGHQLRYVSAWEMRNAVEAAARETANPL